MQRKSKKFVLFSVILIISILFSRCQNEEYVSNSENKNLRSAKTWFNKYKEKEEFHPAFENIDYYWQNANIEYLENGSVAIAVPMKDNPENPDYKGKKILYLYPTDNGYEAVVHETFPKSEAVSNSENKNEGFKNLDSFSGYILTWNLKEGFVKGAEFENGVVVTNISFAQIFSENKEFKTYNMTHKAPPTAPIELDPVVISGGTGGGGCGGCGGVIRFTPTLGGGSIGGGTGGYIGSPNGGGSSISAPTSKEIVNALEKQINSDKLNPCQKEVLEMLKNATNSDIAAMLNKLGADKIYTVTFYSENPINGTPAATQRMSQYNYKIQLSTDYSGATKLFRAGNILHELGHAYFMSIKDDYSSTTPPNAAVFNNYPVLFQGYVEKKFPNMYDAHHIEMANQYIDAIAQTLQEYNKPIDPNGIIPYQVYTDLAWGGLQGTPEFEEKFKIGTAERLRIENRYAAEQTGSSVGYSNGQLQNAVGKPCN